MTSEPEEISTRPFSEGDTVRGRVLVIGHDDTDVTRRVLRSAGVRVTHLRSPVDREIRRALSDPVDAVVIISRDDHASLRIALVVEGWCPGCDSSSRCMTAMSRRSFSARRATRA